MSPLSVVVPVHDVEDFLPRCLDSLLEDTSVPIEVVAVDDASNDSSGSILDQYASVDERVVVVHLDTNLGLGGARNAGIEVATGDHVWCVDSDDWVAPGAVSRVLAWLAEDDPDVLLVGHARVFERSVERGDMDHVLESLPRSFRASECPAVFDLYPAVWTKIFRRELLSAVGLDFPCGAYEDLPVTLPLLCAATRLSARPGVCLYYRQRPGSIIYTAGPHHLDVVDQYELAWQRIERITCDEVLRSAIYTMMVRHLFRMPGLGRISENDLDAFVRRAAVVARRYRPHRSRPRAGDRVRGWLLRAGRPTLTATLRRVWLWTSSVTRPAKVTRRTIQSVTRRFRTGLGVALGRRVLMRAYYALQRRRRVDPQLAVYIAYWGEQVLSCNPGAIYHRARALAPGVRGVWAVASEIRDSVPEGVEHVVVGSAGYYRTLATAKFVISNTSLHDEYVKRKGTMFVQTQHGTPLKAMGIEARDLAADQAAGVLRRATAWDVVISSNPHSSSVWRRAFPVPAELLEIGYPRNDALVNADDREVARVRALVGVGRDTITVLYAPTFREETGDAWLLDAQRLAAALGSGHSVLVRLHHRDRAGRLERVPGVTDVAGLSAEEAMLASDVLITDYSSLMFDFALLDRPIVVFGADWGDYREVRGAYLDLETIHPGVFARDLDEVVDAFRAGSVDDGESRRRRRVFRDRFCPWDDGNASDRAVMACLLRNGEAP